MSLKESMGLHKGSASRALMWTVVGFTFGWMVAVGVADALGQTKYAYWVGYVDWLDNFAFGSIGAYLLNEYATAWQRRKGDR